MKKSAFFVLWLALFLIGCAAPQGPAPTETPSRTPDPYARLPTSITITEASLFSGPGNTGYEVTATLPAGEAVALMGIYGDFVQVHLANSQQVGFIWKDMVEEMPSNLQVLAVNDVPWIEEDFVYRNCMGPFTSINTDGTTVINDYSPGPGGYQLEGAPIQLGSQTQLTIAMETNNGKTAWIEMADVPFRSYGEWYLGYRRVTIFKGYNGYEGYSIEFRDGLKPDAITIPLTKLGDVPFHLIFIDPFGRKIQITDLVGNIKYEFTIPGIDYEGTSLSLPDGFFPEQTLYLSCASDGPTSVSFSEHTMSRAPAGVWEETEDPPPSLLTLARQHDIDIILPSVDWNFGDQRYATIVRQQSSMEYLVAEVSAPNFWLGKDNYNFDYLDHLTDFILQDGRKIMATIVYGPAPELVPEDIRNGSFTQDEYREILHDYVSTVTCRYKDKVSIWMIANESVGARVINAYDFWADKVGWNYVDLAFQWARGCDPDGILLLNDTQNENRSDPNTTLYADSMLATIRDMKARGIPLDAVGIQGHFFEPWESMVPPTKDGVIWTMQGYAELGVDVYITELDVNLSRVEGSHDEKWGYQAQIYKIMMDACLESGVCKGFGVFGIDDPHCWGICFPDFGCPPEVLPEALWFDADFKPKPAFYAVMESLQEH